MESSFFQNKNDSYIENSQLKNIFPNEKAKSSIKEKSFILKRNNNFLEEIQKQQNRSFHNRNLIKIESVKIEISSYNSNYNIILKNVKQVIFKQFESLKLK